jgi:FAD/FMN-containing dehydrogenase
VHSFIEHIGDGSFQIFIAAEKETKINNRKEQLKVQNLFHTAINLAIEMNGTCASEHGIGTEKMKYLEVELGRDTINLMRSIKKLFDPKNILNPGKIFF